MSASSRKPERRDAPDPAPPAFHRTAKVKRKKPWAIEWRVVRGPLRGIFGEWSVIRRYRTRADAEKALATQERQDWAWYSAAAAGWSEYRIAEPDGTA